MDSLRNKVLNIGVCTDMMDIKNTAREAVDIIDEIEPTINLMEELLREMNKVDIIECDELLKKVEEISKSLY